MRIEYVTHDTQNEDGNTILVSIDSYYWSEKLSCWIPIVLYKRTESIRTIDSWRATLRRFGCPTLFVKRRT